MGRQRRLSGRIYDCYSENTFIIDCISKDIIGMVLYLRAKKIDYVDKRREEAEQHDFPKNFEGIFKSTETDGIMKMVEDTFHHRCLSLMSL